MRALVEHRAAINLALAAIVGVLGLRGWPFPADNVFLAAISVEKPWLFDGLAYLYATLWFSTPLIGISLASALLTIVALRQPSTVSYSALPAYPDPAERPEP